MIIHREGRLILLVLAALLAGLNILLAGLPAPYNWIIPVASGLLFLFVLQFFRNPRRNTPVRDPALVYAPADGRIVVIEETLEEEYFQDKRLQLSIFMSPLNVHANRVPIPGRVVYKKYHPGKYLVAWHPKSSSENERLSLVIENDRHSLLVRQIAGAVARRIRNYLEVGQLAVQGEEMGFIKFGSRVDVFLPVDAVIEVRPGMEVKAGINVLARLP